MQVGADVAELAQLLLKPLRPLWLSQESRMWRDSVPPLESLSFTPVILVSASMPNARQRCSTGAWRLANPAAIWRQGATCEQ